MHIKRIERFICIDFFEYIICIDFFLLFDAYRASPPLSVVLSKALNYRPSNTDAICEYISQRTHLEDSKLKRIIERNNGKSGIGIHMLCTFENALTRPTDAINCQ